VVRLSGTGDRVRVGVRVRVRLSRIGVRDKDRVRG
jgi:hypothetical protein